MIDWLTAMGYRGIVIAGTGLGHVNKPLYPALKRAVQTRASTVVMTVQTLWGFAQMYVYDTGRDMMDLGIIPLDNMLPETAYMKLAWVLGQTTDLAEVKKIMLTPIAGEITDASRTTATSFSRAASPEVEEFISKYRK